MARPVRVDDRDEHVGNVEREVIVSAVPEDHVGLRLGLFQYRPVVDARVHDEPLVDVRLVLLHLLDRALVALHVLQRREALHLLGREIPVRHGMTDDHGLLAHPLEDLRHAAGCLALPAAGADGAHGDDGQPRFDHCRPGAEELEVRPQRDHPGGLLHHVLVGDVGVGEHRLVYFFLAEQPLQLGLRDDGDALRVERTCEVGRIAPVGDVRDLRGGEGHDTDGGVVAVYAVEVVKVAPGRAHYDDASLCHC